METTTQNSSTVVSRKESCLRNSLSTKNTVRNRLLVAQPTRVTLITFTSKAIRLTVIDLVSKIQLIEACYPFRSTFSELVSFMQGLVIAELQVTRNQTIYLPSYWEGSHVLFPHTSHSVSKNSSMTTFRTRNKEHFLFGLCNGDGICEH